MTNREAYLKKLEAQLDEWSAELEKLKAKGKEASADLSIKYNRQVEEFGQKMDAARSHAKTLKEASDDAWEDMKGGAEAAWSELKDAFGEIFSSRK